MAGRKGHTNGAGPPQPPPLPPVTSGRAWRAARVEGYPQLLYSGNVVRLRPVDLATLLIAGQIPDLLTGLVYRVLFEGIDAPGFKETPESESEQTRKIYGLSRDMLPLVDLVCKAAFVSPRIVDDPIADDEIAIDDVSLQERIHVFNLVTSGVDLLRTFRYEPGADVEPLPAGENADAETKPAGEAA